MRVSFRSGLIYQDGGFGAGTLEIDAAGRIAALTEGSQSKLGEGLRPMSQERDMGHPGLWDGSESVALPGRAMLPGFVNVHSHSFQRLIRGRAEARATSGKDFWSWRGTMYRAAAQLSPEDVFDVARMTFLEMVKAGTTTVGEFHYLHRAPDGAAYADVNLLAKQVIEAARSVGIRIVLLRSAYLRSGFGMARDAGQTRFIENVTEFVTNLEALIEAYKSVPDEVGFGVAPHSIRAVPLDELKEIVAWGRERKLPVHMHVAEQLRENAECVAEHGVTPVELLAREGLLREDFTGVHAIHITDREIAALAAAGGTVCACPTTERNLGDGVLAADKVMAAGIPVALGSDSQAQIDPMEDARELDYHLRLEQQQRAVLDGIDGVQIARRLFECATRNGARSLRIDAGELSLGKYADFVTVDLDDLSLARIGAEELLPGIVFGMQRGAVKDLVVGGRLILRKGRHSLEDEIVERYKRVSKRVWG